MRRTRLATTLLMLFITACASAKLDVPDGWQSSLHVDHPLVGTIWDSKREQFIESEELLLRLEGASYLLLGEKHDNPDHHALQLAVFDYFIQRQKISGVSFEMMDSEQQPLLNGLSTRQLKDLNAINEYLQWDNDGWDWAYYGPLLRAVITAGVDISAANISNEKMMQVYAEPASAEIEGILNPDTMTALEKDIDESHCGMLPASQFPAMVRVQQARDYAMAQSLAEAFPTTMQILIAGNYHIRHDLGVPNYLLHEQPGLNKEQIVSVAFMEVDLVSFDPAEYLQQFGTVKAYDYIWFTPAISDEDYCASLNQQ